MNRVSGYPHSEKISWKTQCETPLCGAPACVMKSIDKTIATCMFCKPLLCFFPLCINLLEEEVTVVLYLCILVKLLHEVTGILHHTLLLCRHDSLLVILHRTV